MEMTGSEPTGKLIQRHRNFYPEMKQVWEPHSLYWASKERKGDLAKAHNFASKEGYEVIVYPRGTTKPLEKAKAYMRGLHGGR